MICLINSRQVFAWQSIKIVGRNEIVINVFGMSKFEKRFQLLLALVQSSKKRLPDKESSNAQLSIIL